MLGEALGIKTTDSGELVKKLSEFHAEDIIAATNEITKHQVKYLVNENVEIFISLSLLSSCNLVIVRTNVFPVFENERQETFV